MVQITFIHHGAVAWKMQTRQGMFRVVCLHMEIKRRNNRPLQIIQQFFYYSYFYDQSSFQHVGPKNQIQDIKPYSLRYHTETGSKYAALAGLN